VTRYIEYYEVKTANGYLYYSMPVNPDAKNKQNFDGRSHRIWKLDAKTNRIDEIYNIREGKPQIDSAEFFKIQLMAEPVPYDEYYLKLKEVKWYREQREAEESAIVDQVQDT
jgi:hypothetical protein